MLHTVRQFVRYTTLSVGFLLFFILAFRAAQTVNDRQAVTGKHLIPAAQIATIGARGFILNADNANISPVSPTNLNQTESSVNKATSTDKSKNDVAAEHASAASTTDSGKQLGQGHDK